MVARRLLIILFLSASCAPPRVTERQGPEIALARDIWDFGTIKRGETASTEIRLGNRGSDTLFVSLYSTCDCLRATIEARAIASDTWTSISLSLTGDEIAERLTKTLFVDSNDPVNPRLSVKTTGQVIQGTKPHLVAIPNPLPFERSESAYPANILTISNRGVEDLAIEEVRCFGCMNAWSERILHGGEEALLHIELLPGWPDKRWIEIESNDPVFSIKKISIVELE